MFSSRTKSGNLQRKCLALASFYYVQHHIQALIKLTLAQSNQENPWKDLFGISTEIYGVSLWPVVVTFALGLNAAHV